MAISFSREALLREVPLYGNFVKPHPPVLSYHSFIMCRLQLIGLVTKKSSLIIITMTGFLLTLISSILPLFCYLHVSDLASKQARSNHISPAQ